MRLARSFSIVGANDAPELSVQRTASVSQYLLTMSIRAEPGPVTVSDAVELRLAGDFEDAEAIEIAAAAGPTGALALSLVNRLEMCSDSGQCERARTDRPPAASGRRVAVRPSGSVVRRDGKCGRPRRSAASPRRCHARAVRDYRPGSRQRHRPVDLHQPGCGSVHGRQGGRNGGRHGCTRGLRAGLPGLDWWPAVVSRHVAKG